MVSKIRYAVKHKVIKSVLGCWCAPVRLIGYGVGSRVPISGRAAVLPSGSVGWAYGCSDIGV